MNTWHVDERLMHRYDEGELDPANAASIEAHLVGCAACRAITATTADAERLDATWLHIVDTIDQPRPKALERVLRALGTRDHIARLIGATPSLQLSWLLSVAFVLGFAAAGAHIGPRGVLAFLSLAPLIPLAGIGVAYGPGVDPAYEVSVAAPMPGFRLLLLRAGVVLATSTVLLGATAWWLPAGWKSAAWLLPSLGLSLVSLALGTFVDPLRAAVGVSVGWVAVLAVAARAGIRGSGPILDRMVVFNTEGQIAFAIVAGIAAIALVLRARAVGSAVEG